MDSRGEIVGNKFSLTGLSRSNWATLLHRLLDSVFVKKKQTRPGCFCAKDCLDSVQMYTWWYTFTCTGGGGLHWAVLGCAGLYWAVLGCTGLYWDVLGCTGLYWDVLGCTGL